MNDGTGQGSDSFEDFGRRQAAEEDEEDEENVYKNWRPPNKDTDFAAHAGQAEKKVLQRLNFDLRLDGREIGMTIGSGKPPHGLDAKGYLTQDALRHLGIGNYTRLWRRSGKVVEEARQILRREKHSAAARKQVLGARDELLSSIFYRQLDVMAFRFQPQHTQKWYAHKEALLKKGRREILEEYRRDCEDRERIRLGEAIASTRRQELVSACQSHTFQLGMRHETMLELQGLPGCQCRSVRSV